MLTGDDADAASEQEERAGNNVITHAWDPDRRTARLFRPVLELHGPAWDVYLVYDRGVRWESEMPPTPTMWMHQLQSSSGAPEELLLNPGRFEDQIHRLVRAGSKSGAK